MSTFDEMNKVLKEQKEFFNKNGAPSIDLRIDRLERLKTLIILAVMLLINLMNFIIRSIS